MECFNCGARATTTQAPVFLCEKCSVQSRTRGINFQKAVREPKSSPSAQGEDPASQPTSS
jgi:hypothetical protein